MVCRNAWIPILWMILAAPVVTAEDGPAPPGPLPQSETLDYSIEWRLITAGKARILWAAPDPEQPEVKFHIESTGLVSKLFRVNDNYTASLRSNLCVTSTYLTAEEGRRHRETRVTYDAAARKAQYLEKDLEKQTVLKTNEIEIPACVHDVVGGLFHLRTMQLPIGGHTEVPVSDGKKCVMARVEAQQREEVDTPAGKFQAVRYEVFLFNNVLYRRSGHLFVWLTDDRRRLPVQIRVRLQFAIGTITLQLEKEERT